MEIKRSSTLFFSVLFKGKAEKRNNRGKNQCENYTEKRKQQEEEKKNAKSGKIFLYIHHEYGTGKYKYIYLKHKISFFFTTENGTAISHA